MSSAVRCELITPDDAPADNAARPVGLSGQIPTARVEKHIRLLHLSTVPLFLRFLNGQAQHMREGGIEVHVLSSPGDELDSFAVREQVQVYAVPMERRITPLRDVLAVVRIYRVLRALRPAIVQAHTPKGGLLGMIAAWLARIKVRIYHVHGLRFITSTGFERGLLRWTERISCLLAHRVLCVSRSVREVAIAEGICPAEKIRVLLGGSINGIDIQRFQPAGALERASARAALGIPEDAFVVGFVGRVVREKGIVELATAWRALREMFGELRLFIVGWLEAQDPVPAEVLDALRSDPRVIMRDRDWDTPPLYQAMDLLALPTYREGFPTAPMEAAAMGLPVVATRIPGCVDAVEDGVTGTLVPPRDVGALVEAIARYRMNPELAQAHGRAGRAFVARGFSQEAIWNAMRAEYFTLLAERGCRSRRPLLASEEQP